MQQQPYYPVQGQDSLNFQSFDYQDNTTNFQHQNTGGGYESYGNVENQVSWASVKRAFSAGSYDNEPPLLEGIDVEG